MSNQSSGAKRRSVSVDQLGNLLGDSSLSGNAPPTPRVDPQEELMQDYREAGDDLLNAIMAFASDTLNPEPLEIVVRRSNGKEIKFLVKPLSESEFDHCRRFATKSTSQQKFAGLSLPTDIDGPRYNSAVIHAATLPESRRLLWDNRDLWKMFKVTNQYDLIDRLLFGGEKSRVVDKISDISGYGTVPAVEEQAKNS